MLVMRGLEQYSSRRRMIKCVAEYYSQKFTPSERNYCITKKESLAVVKSLEHFHLYLYGVRFTVKTDHTVLQWLKMLKIPGEQLARWTGKLE